MNEQRPMIQTTNKAKTKIKEEDVVVFDEVVDRWICHHTETGQGIVERAS